MRISLARHQYSETNESSSWKKHIVAKHIIIYKGLQMGNASLILALLFFYFFKVSFPF